MLGDQDRLQALEQRRQPSEMGNIDTIGDTEREAKAIKADQTKQRKKAAAESERLRQDLVGTPSSSGNGRAA
jgi:hypothetical protein